MLASVNRLTGKKNYDKVKQEGQLFQSSSFGLSVLKRKDDGPSRFGFIVSNKISKHASMRNKVKRTLREAARQSLSYLRDGYDVVFLAKSSIVRKYSSDLMQEVIDSFKAVGLISAFKKTPTSVGNELNADMSSSFRGNPALKRGEDVMK